MNPDHDPALTGQLLDGLEPSERAFEEALQRGRLHHAWLLTGPQGLGKAAFAHRAARRLLGARPDPMGGVLASSAEDTVNRLIMARSHPDFISLDRYGEDGKLRRNISVDDARRLPEFFAKAPALAPYRVAVIDAADDLNVNAANAVLKTLEEPPPKGVLFLVSHAPGRLLPTIRSRCRRLAVCPWSDTAIAGLLERRFAMASDEALRLAPMAAGSPGQALNLAESGAAAVDQAADALLASLPQTDDAMLVSLVDSFRGGEGAQRFATLIERISDKIAAAIRDPDLAPSLGRSRWADVWSRLKALPGEVDGLNLDRVDAFWSVIADLRSAARLAPLSMIGR